MNKPQDEVHAEVRRTIGEFTSRTEYFNRNGAQIAEKFSDFKEPSLSQLTVTWPRIAEQPRLDWHGQARNQTYDLLKAAGAVRFINYRLSITGNWYVNLKDRM